LTPLFQQPHLGTVSSSRRCPPLCRALPGLSAVLCSSSAPNCRTVRLGRNLWRSFGPPPLLKQGHPQPVAQDHVQMAVEDRQGWRLHNLPEQSVPALGHPQSKKKHFLMFRGTSCVSVCACGPVFCSLKVEFPSLREIWHFGTWFSMVWVGRDLKDHRITSW